MSEQGREGATDAQADGGAAGDAAAGDAAKASATERAARALRIALLTTAGACVVLGVLGVGVVLLTGADSPTLWPGLSLFALGQVIALVAAVVAGAGLRRVLRGSAPRPVTASVRRALGRLGMVHLIAVIVLAAAWIVVRPTAVIAVVACALVSAQLAALLHLLKR